MYIRNWSKEKYKPIGKRTFKHGKPIYFAACSSVMGNIFKNNMKVLDYGCGPGKYANFLSQHLINFTYYGIEPKSEHGELCIKRANDSYGHDKRVKFGFIGEPIEKEATELVDTVILMSIFTHLKIEQTEKILKKLNPIIRRGGVVVFTMIIAPKYFVSKDNRYALKDTYGVVQNTKDQVSRLAKKLNYSITLEDEWLSPSGSWLHSIYKCKKNMKTINEFKPKRANNLPQWGHAREMRKKFA